MARLSKRQDDNWFIKFVPKEWLEDNQLRRCGRYARGLWIDMICVMHNETVRGTLPGDLQVLARLLPGGIEGLAEGLAELEANGVFSRGAEIDPRRLPADSIVSRRMYRENRLSMDRSEAGRRGAEVTNGKRRRNPGKLSASGAANSPANGRAVLVNSDGPESEIPAFHTSGKTSANPQQVGGIIVRDQRSEVKPAERTFGPTTARACGAAPEGDATRGGHGAVSKADAEDFLRRLESNAGLSESDMAWWGEAVEALRQRPAAYEEVEREFSKALRDGYANCAQHVRNSAADAARWHGVALPSEAA